MNTDLEECLRSIRNVKIDPSVEIIEKEMEGSFYDLRRARESVERKDFKWASIRAESSLTFGLPILFG